MFWEFGFSLDSTMSVSKTFEMAFVVGAALQAQFATVMNKATQKTTNLEKAVKNLQKANSDISSVLKQRVATEKARNEVSVVVERMYD